jgi:NAD+ synthase (glutamine-hydrolysing)
VLLDQSLEALDKIRLATRDWQMLVSVGLPLAVGNAVYNCAASVYGGEVKAVVPKTYLPEYREFWEKRWFAAADDAPFDQVALFGQAVSFGTRIVLEHVANRDLAVHVQICEDGWLRFSPSGEAALNGATVLANLSASNVTIGKADFRRHVLGEASSAFDLSAQLYVSAGFGESTTDVSWDGQGFICERGETVAETDRFRLEPSYLVHDVDLGQLVADRRMQGSFRDSAVRLRRRLKPGESSFRWVEFGEKQEDAARQAVFHRFLRTISPHPFVPAQSARLNDRCYEVFNIQATSLARRLNHRPGTKLVEGLSGGLDSSHALLVAVRAMDLLRRPRPDIICLTMPGFGTTGRTRNNARTLAEALGVTIRTVPITAQAEAGSQGIVEKLLGLVGHDGLVHDLAFENAQAWCRKIIELATAAKEGGLVLGTGDLSELALGWCTMFGDHASHYGVNAGVPKTLVRFLVQWTSAKVFENEKHVQAVLADILDTPISPELLPPSGEEIAQITEEKIGPYELHDFTLYWGVRFGVRPSTIVRLALQAFDSRYTLAEIVKWQRVFWERFFAAQYKRSCLPDGPKVGLVCLSPRGDWRMPSDASAAAWLSDLDQVPDSL